MTFFLCSSNGLRQELVPHNEYRVALTQQDGNGWTPLILEKESFSKYLSSCLASISIGSSMLPQIRPLRSNDAAHGLKISLAGFESLGGMDCDLSPSKTVGDGQDNSAVVLDLRPHDMVCLSPSDINLEVTYVADPVVDIQIGSSVPRDNAVSVAEAFDKQQQTKDGSVIERSTKIINPPKTPKPLRTCLDVVEETPTTNGKRYRNAIRSSPAENSIYNTAPDTETESQSISAEGSATINMERKKVQTTSPSPRLRNISKTYDTGASTSATFSPSIRPHNHRVMEARAPVKSVVRSVRPSISDAEFASGNSMTGDDGPEREYDKFAIDVSGNLEGLLEEEDRLLLLANVDASSTSSRVFSTNKEISESSQSVAEWTRKRKTNPDDPKCRAKTYDKRRKTERASQHIERRATSSETRTKALSNARGQPGKPRALRLESITVYQDGGATCAKEVDKDTASPVPPILKSIGRNKPRVALTNSDISLQANKPCGNIQQLCVISESVDDSTDILCIGGKEIKTTSKTLLAVILGKWILSDEWVRASASAESLLNPADYFFDDPGFCENYGRTAEDIHQHPLPELFAGKIIYITPALKKAYKGGYHDMERILKCAGAAKVLSKLVRDTTAITNNRGQLDDIVILGYDEHDEQLAKLDNENVTFYNRDFVSNSIFAGRLLLDQDNLMLRPSIKAQKPKTSSK